MKWFINWAIDWLDDLFDDWFIWGLTDWIIEWLIDWLIDWLIGWFINCINIVSFVFDLIYFNLNVYLICGVQMDNYHWGYLLYKEICGIIIYAFIVKGISGEEFARTVCSGQTQSYLSKVSPWTVYSVQPCVTLFHFSN